MENLQAINIKDYNYELPDQQIAKFPLQQRDQSKLLVYKDGCLQTQVFEKLTDYLPKNTHLVFNNTKVIPARIYFQNDTGAIIEVLLLKPYNIEYSASLASKRNTQWECIIGNKKRWKSANQLSKSIIHNSIKIDIHLKWIDFEKNILEFNWLSSNSEFIFSELLAILGEIPLPPYLNRKPEKDDSDRYQTVYSDVQGAVAAPTAGLHFTKNVFDKLSENSFSYQYITLHIGAGTFLPVKTENALDHEMHREQIIFQLSEIEKLLENLENIIPVGTTSMRSLESLFWYGVKLILTDNQPNTPFFIEKLYPYKHDYQISAQQSLEVIIAFMRKNNLNKITGETEILIVPGYSFKICKGIITNFHQPQSTLILLIAALIGPKWKDVYKYALQNNYRFLSFGDSSLLLPQ
jgi:S-adenosylmethionine:tRNA ribosyltransferase-isomerase